MLIQLNGDSIRSIYVFFTESQQKIIITNKNRVNISDFPKSKTNPLEAMTGQNFLPVTVPEVDGWSKIFLWIS